jgi:hypothetical protein
LILFFKGGRNSLDPLFQRGEEISLILFFKRGRNFLDPLFKREVIYSDILSLACGCKKVDFRISQKSLEQVLLPNAQKFEAEKAIDLSKESVSYKAESRSGIMLRDPALFRARIGWPLS